LFVKARSGVYRCTVNSRERASFRELWMGKREAGQDPTFISEEHRRNVTRARDRGHDVPTSSFARSWLARGAGFANVQRRRNIRVASFCSLQRVTVLSATRRYSRAPAETVLRSVLLCRIACTLVTRALDNAWVRRRKDETPSVAFENGKIHQVLFLARATSEQRDNGKNISPDELRLLINKYNDNFQFYDLPRFCNDWPFRLA